MMEKMKLKELVKQFIPMNYWNTRRKASIIRQQGKVADFWAPILKAYYNGEIERYSLKPKKKLGTQKVIWQYWGQGIDKDELPEIIQICFDSVDRNKNDYQVIRLTDITISEYIDLPDFVWRKREYVQFTRTFFSDLLRVALLSTYGWMLLFYSLEVFRLSMRRLIFLCISALMKRRTRSTGKMFMLIILAGNLILRCECCLVSFLLKKRARLFQL